MFYNAYVKNISPSGFTIGELTELTTDVYAFIFPEYEINQFATKRSYGNDLMKRELVMNKFPFYINFITRDQ